ncbi:MAG: phospho-sugar mutase [Leptospira sp.]|nr:phospho-sugar mutase [Leptospira sp.]
MLSKEDFINAWTKPPFSPEVQSEAKSILSEFRSGKSSPEIEGYTIPLEFGTGGIRGVIGNGIGKMNDFTVGRAALGFCRYILTTSKKPLIVIACDSRRKSREFSEVTAGIAASMGIRVKIFKEVCPTPLLSFAIRHYKAQGGVVITASHNPPEYNGFKAYLSDGGQLVPPADGKIIGLIDRISNWNEINLTPKTSALYKNHVSFVENSVFEDYKKKVFNSPIYNKKIQNKERAKLRIVYSPLHGTGGVYMKNLLNALGYKHVILVKEQEKPNGEFPTVKYPNPEEREALVLSEACARANNADIFIATDPDADRVGFGIRNSSGGYSLLNGNQAGSIMAAYLCEKFGGGKSKTEHFLFKTIVTTDLQESIAKKNRIKMKNVLTGFKYIAEEMKKLDGNKTKKFLFGGEESYGYLPVDFVRDKDSLSSALLLLEILTDKKDILGYLNAIYLKYGFYMESLKSLTFKGEAGKAKIKQSLENLRKENLIGKNIGKRKIISFMDYKNKNATGVAKKSVFSGLPASDVIQIGLTGNAKLTIRPSGTEPKVKIYSSFMSEEKSKTNEDIDKNRELLLDEIKQSEAEFMQLAGLND